MHLCHTSYYLALQELLLLYSLNPVIQELCASVLASEILLIYYH